MVSSRVLCAMVLPKFCQSSSNWSPFSNGTAVLFPKSKAASVSPLTLAIWYWSPSSPGAAVLSEEELNWLQAVHSYSEEGFACILASGGASGTSTSTEVLPSSQLAALRDLPQAPPGFPVYPDFFGHVRQFGQGTMVWRLPHGCPRARRGLRLRRSRADAHFSRHQLPGREEVHEAHGQTHKARGVWMSCASPEAAASAELAQATTGSELGAPCDERQHFLVRGSAVGEYY